MAASSTDPSALDMLRPDIPRRLPCTSAQLLICSTAFVLLGVSACVVPLLWLAPLPLWVSCTLITWIAFCVAASMCICAYLTRSIRTTASLDACGFLPSELHDIFLRLAAMDAAAAFSQAAPPASDQEEHLRSPMQLWRCFLHEFGVPLHALSWGCDFILQQVDRNILPPLSGEYREVLSEMREQVGVMHHVLNNARATDELLNSSTSCRTLSRTPSVCLEIIDLEYLMTSTASLYFAKAHAFRCHLKTDLQSLPLSIQLAAEKHGLRAAPRSCYVRGDAQLLRRILAHLFNFTMHRDSRVVLSLAYEDVTLLTSEDTVCGGSVLARICIAESGPGVLADEVQALKQLFLNPRDMSAACLDMNHPIQGLRGMSLRLCSELLKSKGGTIWCEGDAAQSSVVYQITLSLPLEFSSRPPPITPGPLTRTLVQSLRSLSDVVPDNVVEWSLVGAHLQSSSSSHLEHSPASDLAASPNPIDASSSSPVISIAPKPMESPPTLTAAPVSMCSRRHILIVEDHIVTQKLMKRMLSQMNMTSEVAENGQVCKERLARSDLPPFDAVLMDGSMPVLNGVDTVRALRTVGNLIPVIGVTANSLDADVQAFLDAGADAVLTKPVAMNTVLATLERILQARTAAL